MSCTDRFRFLKTIIFWGLSIAILILTLIVITNISPVLAPTIEPKDTHNIQEFHLFYPDTYLKTIPLNAINRSGVSDNPEYLSVDMILEYDGVLSEGTPVTVTAYGFLYPKGERIISPLVIQPTTEMLNNSILVGFDSASSYDRSPNVIGFESEFPLKLLSVEAIQYFNSSQLVDFPVSKTIVWETQGEYSPRIEIPTHNGLVIATFDTHKIHVSSRDVILQGEYSRISAVLAIVLYFFTFISGCEILYKLRPDSVSNLLGIEPDPKKSENNCPKDPQETSDNQTKICNNP